MRYVCCALRLFYQVAEYGKEKVGIKNLMYAVGRQINFRGFLVTQWANQFPEALTAIGKLMASGQLKWKEDRFSWDEYPSALQGLLTGSKFGKAIVVGTKQDGRDEL